MKGKYLNLLNQSQRHHITPLFINSLGGGHTNTHTVLRFCAWLAGGIEPGITIPSDSG